MATKTTKKATKVNVKPTSVKGKTKENVKTNSVVEKEVSSKKVEVENTKTNFDVNKYIKLAKDNKNILASFGVGVLVTLFVMMLIWPKRIVKLANGEEVLATINGENITADGLFNEFKKSNGLLALLEIVDKTVLSDIYKDLEEEALTSAKEQAEYYYNMYNTYYGYTKEEFLAVNGYTEEEFVEYLKLEYFYEKYEEDYLESLITDSDIENEYSNVFGDKEVYLFYTTDSDNDLENIRKELKNGTSFENIKDKYTDVTCANTTIEYVKSTNYTETFIKNLKNLKEEEYTKVFSDDYYGNVVIYLVESSDKGSKDEERGNIISKLKSDLRAKDDTISIKATIDLREKYNLSINDTELKNAYNEYVSSYK